MRSKLLKSSLAAKSPKTERYTIGDQLSFAASEAYKLLRTNLNYTLIEERRCKVIGVTSSLPHEGKSTTSINLAYTMAQAGQKVMLLEADMRLPTISKRLSLEPAPGLSNLLAGLCSGRQVIQESGLLPNLYVITAGDTPPNPSELLGSEQMAAAIKALAQEYDCILIDLPPISAVADALVISKLLSGVIVVVRQNYCTRQVLRETMRQLALPEAKILGFVMTAAETQVKRYKKYGYGDKDGYGYGYGASHKQDAQQAGLKGGSND